MIGSAQKLLMARAGVVTGGGGGAGIDGTLEYSIINPNDYGTTGSDRFGDAVATCESYTVVGAYLEDDAGGSSSGKAYIFDNSDGSLLYTLDNPNGYSTSASDFFGEAVAICESYTIVGASGEDDAGGTSSGKAYIFDNSDGSLLYTLDNPNDYDTSAYDYFGASVGICESYAIVGARGEDDAGGTFSGKAYIFDNSDGSLLYTLDNPNDYSTSASDNFGWAVSICESYAAVGAVGEDDAGGNSSGKAYIFDNSDGSLLYTLDNPNDYSTSASDQFGYSVSICESYAIVGVPFEDDATHGLSAGRAYIFDMSDGSLLYTLDPSASSEQFGYSVAICESYAIVGAYFSNSRKGAAYIFDTSDGSLLYSLADPDAYTPDTGRNAYDYFGASVGISESKAVVGAWGEADTSGTRQSGYAYIYT